MSTRSAGEMRGMVMTRARFWILLTCGALTAALAALPSRALAAEAESDDDEAGYDTAEVQRLSEEASRAYKQVDFKKARDRLEKALALAREGEPKSNPVVARLRLYLGMVLYVGFKNADAAAGQFRVARRLDPEVAPPPGLFNPEVAALFARTTGQGSKDANKDADKSAATEPAGDAVDEAALLGPPPPLASGPAEPPAAKSSPAASQRAPQTPSPGVASEPGAPDGEQASPPASSENAPDSQQPDAAAPSEPADKPDGGPIVVRAPSRPAPRRPVAAVEEEDDGDDDAVARPVMLTLSAGSGAGAATGPLDAPGVSPNRAPGRFGLAGGGQVVLSAGYFVSRSWLLALEGRLQLVTGTSAHCTGDACDATPSFAAAGFARATYFLGDSGLRPYGSFGLGGGAIRQSVKLAGLTDCGAQQNQSCATTVAGGPLLGSLGAGLAYDGGVVVGMLGLTANGGVPHLMLSIDVSLGVGVRF